MIMREMQALLQKDTVLRNRKDLNCSWA
ncbi:hypothetical protein C5167_036173 [Papaver somniferum]|nr:hypothetical protein C5167_036173 [Papaver somniferum]